MARVVEFETAKVFRPLLNDARYLGAWGGRGSGKSHFFAELAIEKCLLKPGTRVVCIREVQNTLKNSSKRLIEDKLAYYGIGQSDGFIIQSDQIITPGGGVIIFIGMQDRNSENIKSIEGFDFAWVEEAHTLSSVSLELLKPTIRNEGSQLWFSWNARRKTDPVDVMLRGENIPSSAIVVQANWRDNPKFPSVLEEERQDCLRMNPDQYGHIWEGEYAGLLAGSYFASGLNMARAEGRISNVSRDMLLPVKLFVDIGGTGARSDAFTIWAAQHVGKEIRVLDYYESQGQPIGTHLDWLNAHDFKPFNSRIYLPHDGVQHDKVYAVSYESAFTRAGYEVIVVKNQGAGAAMSRIASVRRVMPACWFDKRRTEPGIDALGWYHEKIDTIRNIGLGPEHDWASHGADAFGLLAVVSESEMAEVKGWTTDNFNIPANASGSYTRSKRHAGYDY